MSTFKKVVSLVLCLTMLLGTVAVAGIAVPAALAADATPATSHTGEESVIKTIAELETGKYAPNADGTYNNYYMYLGIDFYEKDADGEYTLTDHYVQPGQELRGYFYFKSNLWMGAGNPFIIFERAFFDVTNGATNLTYDETYDPDHEDYPTENYPGNIDCTTMNQKHADVAANGNYVKYTTKWARNIPGFTELAATNFCDVPLEESDTWDFWYPSWGRDTTSTDAYQFNEDEHMFTFDVLVREYMPDGKTKLADGTTGFVKIDKRCFKIWDNQEGTGVASSKRQSNISSLTSLGKYAVAKQLSAQTWMTIEDFMTDDVAHTFTIGEPAPEGGDDVVVEATSVIDAIADIETGKYAPKADGSYDAYYMYLGIDFYEKGEDGEYTLTDHYVQPGQALRGYFYFKSNLWMGAGNPFIIFERAFFDVTNGATNLTYDETYDPDHEDYPTENYPGNIDCTTMNQKHADVAANGNYVKYTTKWARNIPGFTELAATNFCDVPLEESDTWDFWYPSWGRDTTSTDAYQFNEDEHMFTFDVLVREYMPDGKTKLADGTTGFVKIDKRCFKIWDNQKGTGVASSKRQSNISSLTAKGKYAVAKQLSAQTWMTIEDFMVDDVAHTFTIGEPESTGTKKYTVTFLENDGTEISSASYKENSTVNVPAAAADELGWANVATGKIVDTVVSGEALTVTKNATYKRVLSTDKFDVTVNLDGGTIDGERTLVIEAGYGEEVDLTQYAPEKEGYNPVWEPATVTVDSINGATAKVKWEAKTFKATFYANKGDAESYNVVEIKYNGVLQCAAPTKEGYSFAGWYNAATDELVSTTPSMGQYKKLEDTSYYAAWSQYPDTITFMAKNFKTGEWAPFYVEYGDGKGTIGAATPAIKLGNTTVSNNIKAKIDVAEDLGWDGDIFYPNLSKSSMSYSETYVLSEMINEDVAFDGAKVIYVHAFPVYQVEFQIPAYDEATGEYTETYTSEVKELKSTTFGGNITYSAAALKPAAGFVFDKWLTVDGEQADYYSTGANYVFALTTDSPARQVVKGTFKLEEYELRFNIGTSDGQTVIPVGINNVGEILNIDTAEFVYATGANKGQPRKLPVIGVVNEDQAEPVPGKEGHKLIGWYIDSEDKLIDFTNFEITSELVSKAYATSEGTKAILIKSKWEAQNYDAKFYYWAEGSTLENPVYTEDPIVVSVPVGTSRDDALKMMSDADIAKLDASAPTGVVRTSTWTDTNGSTVSSAIPVGGMSFYASYTSQKFTLYIDLNRGDPAKDVSPSKNIYPIYGEDATVDRSETERGLQSYAFNYSIGDADKPSAFHEIVDWKVYHVEDDSTYKDPTTWHEGVNDEGTNIVKSSVIYQAQWKHHTEFLFRVYNMSGELTKALDKDFQWHYWKYGRITTKDNAPISTDDTMIILFLKPTFENFNIKEFFKIDMWKNVTLRIDPFYLPKSMFTLESFLGLFKALFTAIGSLIKGG